MATNENSFDSGDVSSQLHFDVSTGLKRVIGRDLITDDEVAIFELVKNSFDAGATQVQLLFSADEVWVVDNGEGMSLEDLNQKWLFVAYSSKNEPSNDVRSRSSGRRHFAGSKGIGRFSADRLGARLTLQSRRRDEDKEPVHQLQVDWSDFEHDSKKSFEAVEISYTVLADFDMHSELNRVTHGTALKVGELRSEWDRIRLLHLKRSLAKLINPFGNSADGFSIEIIAPRERKQDKALVSQAEGNDEQVNGPIGNFIFSTLEEKTTHLRVSISEDGETIESLLTDRGEVVFRIREPSPYAALMNSGFSCQLFYLNQSAKLTFARRMGIPSVRFGSVFLFRNGFRVFPVGEDGDDWFGIDARKQQGYARFLGTRDIIGRIDVSGSEDQFKEASSRNQGLVDTEAVRELRDLFWEYCLKRLERYIVPVSWPDKGEALSEDLSRLMTDSGRARVSAAVAKLIDGPHIELLEYSTSLIAIVNERSGQFETSLASLRSIAAKTSDSELSASLAAAEKRFDELKSAEIEALRVADEERRAKEAAQADVLAALQLADQATQELEEEKARSLLLTSLTSLDAQNIINMHHQITIYAGDMKQQIDNCISATREGDCSVSDLHSRLEQLAFVNQKILSIARIATKANFRLESDTIEADLAAYVEQYINEEARRFVTSRIKIGVTTNSVKFVKRFRPMEVAIVIDNLINNASRATATKIDFDVSVERSGLSMRITDNGKGFGALPEPDRIFELGFSRTSGSGLGLYHVRQVLGDMGGSISIIPSPGRGASFSVRIVK